MAYEPYGYIFDLAKRLIGSILEMIAGQLSLISLNTEPEARKINCVQ